MASGLNLGFSGLDSNSDRGQCFVFMGKKLSSYNTSLCTKASMSTYELLKYLLAMTLASSCTRKRSYFLQTSLNYLKRSLINHVSVFGFQFLKDGYAAHLTALSTETISRPAVGNSRLILRRGCFGLPSRASKTRHKIKRSISDKPSVDSDKECSSTLSGTFNYSSFRHTKGRSVSKFDEQ